MSELTFFELDPDEPAPAQCRYALLPLAYDGTASYVKGAARGPEAILGASQQIELYDEELGFCPSGAGITTLSGPTLEGLTPGAMVEAVRVGVGEALRPDRHLIAIGGEHSIAFPTIEATREAKGDFDVLQIDAHSDLRDSYDGTKYSHGSVMARVRESGLRVTQVGIRSSGPEEREALADEGVTTFWMHEIRERPTEDWIADVIASLGPRIYVTFDFDALDPSIMPSTGTPEPGGFDWVTALALLRSVARERTVAGSDFTELCPIEGFHAPDYLAARLIYRWIGCLEAARSASRG